MSWDQPPPPPAQPGGYPPPGGFQQYPEASQSQTIFILGLLGLLLCGVLAPIAWVMGNTEIAAINAGRRSPAGLSQAKTGRILGIIATVLMAVGIIIWIVVVVGFANRY